VAIEGDVVIVGAYREGAVYLFDCTNPFNCTEESKLFPSDGGGNFGVAVRASGSTIVVGAGAANSHGTAYVFYCSSRFSCTEAYKLFPSDGDSEDRFGDVLAISGTSLAISSVFHDYGGASSDQGKAYFFQTPSPLAVNITMNVSKRTHSGTSGRIGVILEGSLGSSGPFYLGSGFPTSSTWEYKDILFPDVGELYAIQMTNDVPSDGLRVKSLEITYKGVVYPFGRNAMVRASQHFNGIFSFLFYFILFYFILFYFIFSKTFSLVSSLLLVTTSFLLLFVPYSSLTLSFLVPLSITLNTSSQPGSGSEANFYMNLIDSSGAKDTISLPKNLEEGTPRTFEARHTVIQDVHEIVIRTFSIDGWNFDSIEISFKGSSVVFINPTGKPIDKYDGEVRISPTMG